MLSFRLLWKISCSKDIAMIFNFSKKDSITRLALSRNLSKAFCWRRSVRLVTSRKYFGLESLFIEILQTLIVKRKELFFQTKKFPKNLSHLLPRMLPCKFISWTSQKTKMPNWMFFPSIKYNGDSHRGISTSNNIFLQLRRSC